MPQLFLKAGTKNLHERGNGELSPKEDHANRPPRRTALDRLRSWLTRDTETGANKVTVGAVTFLAEQDGPVEQGIKARWEPILKAHPEVTHAYLALASYSGQRARGVVLGLVASATVDLGIVRALSEPIRETMSRDVALDILFLKSDQAVAIARVCKPFYLAESLR